MPYQRARLRAIAAACAEAQVHVVWEPGWGGRGSSVFGPGGHTNHHDVSAPGTSARGTIVNGRPGLAGPLANFYIERDGTLVIVAAGRANHAGRGGYGGLRGNARVWGTEIANNGQGEHYGSNQLYTIIVLNAVLHEVDGIPLHLLHAHHEWTGRKIDPAGPPRWRSPRDVKWDMDRFRADVDRWEINGMASADEIADKVIEKLMATDIHGRGRFSSVVHDIDVHAERSDKRVGELRASFADDEGRLPDYYRERGIVRVTLRALASTLRRMAIRSGEDPAWSVQHESHVPSRVEA